MLAFLFGKSLSFITHLILYSNNFCFFKCCYNFQMLYSSFLAVKSAFSIEIHIIDNLFNCNIQYNTFKDNFMFKYVDKLSNK